MSSISMSVCPWQAYPAKVNVFSEAIRLEPLKDSPSRVGYRLETLLPNYWLTPIILLQSEEDILLRDEFDQVSIS